MARCDIVHLYGERNLLAWGEIGETAARHCEMTQAAAQAVGIEESEKREICRAARAVVGFDYRRKVQYVIYSSARRCPLLSAVIARAALAPGAEILPAAAYTVAQAARALDMSRAAIRRLVRRGALKGVADVGGFLIAGADILRFASQKVAVLREGRRGLIR